MPANILKHKEQSIIKPRIATSFDDGRVRQKTHKMAQGGGGEAEEGIVTIFIRPM